MKTIPLATVLAWALLGSAQAQTQTEPARTGTTGSTVLTDALGNTTFVTSHHPVPPPRDLRAEFDRIDTDRDGSVSRGEASVDEYLVRAFPALDRDRSGRLSFAEMQAWLDD